MSAKCCLCLENDDSVQTRSMVGTTYEYDGEIPVCSICYEGVKWMYDEMHRKDDLAMCDQYNPLERFAEEIHGEWEPKPPFEIDLPEPPDFTEMSLEELDEFLNNLAYIRNCMADVFDKAFAIYNTKNGNTKDE